MTFRKIVSKALFPLCSFLIPIARLFILNHQMEKSDYLVAGALLALQLLCAVIFFRLKPRWSPYLMKYPKQEGAPATLCVEERVSDLFFTSLTFLFAYALPYFFYLDLPIQVPELLVCILFCIDLLESGACFLLGNKARSPQKLPLFCLLGLIGLIAFSPIPNPTTVILMVLCLLCLGLSVFFIQVIRRG